MNKLLGYSLLIVTLFFSCAKKETTNSEPVTVLDILLKDGEISAWQRTGNSWHANSSGELNTYINGAEPVYTQNGFVEAAMQEYEGLVLGSNVSVELTIYDQGNASNSKDLFDELVLQLVNPIDWNTSAGVGAKIERFPLSQKIIFWKSKYYVSLSILSGLDEALDVLKTFANNVNSKIQ